MVRFFGTPWDAPATEGEVFEPTPTDQACIYCLGSFKASDSGVIIPSGDTESQVVSWTYWHRWCYMEDIFGPETTKFIREEVEKRDRKNNIGDTKHVFHFHKEPKNHWDPWQRGGGINESASHISRTHH